MSIEHDTEQRIKIRGIRAVREQTGLHEQLAAPIVDKIIEALHQEFGHERVYFTPSKAGRNAAVKADFDGTNMRAVMRRHGISRATFYRIIGEDKPA